MRRRVSGNFVSRVGRRDMSTQSVSEKTLVIAGTAPALTNPLYELYPNAYQVRIPTDGEDNEHVLRNAMILAVSNGFASISHVTDRNGGFADARNFRDMYMHLAQVHGWDKPITEIHVEAASLPNEDTQNKTLVVGCMDPRLNKILYPVFPGAHHMRCAGGFFPSGPDIEGYKQIFFSSHTGCAAARSTNPDTKSIDDPVLDKAWKAIGRNATVEEVSLQALKDAILHTKRLEGTSRIHKLNFDSDKGFISFVDKEGQCYIPTQQHVKPHKLRATLSLPQDVTKRILKHNEECHRQHTAPTSFQERVRSEETQAPRESYAR